MRYLALVLAALVSLPLAAQQPLKKKRPAQKQAAKKPVTPNQTAHRKPTPEQIRRFNELQKSR